MKKIALNSHTQLALERYSERFDNRLRLVIINSKGEQLACRKESFKKMELFMETEDKHIFKGRLQLFKIADKISVQVKGENIGSIDAGLFRQRLQELAGS